MNFDYIFKKENPFLALVEGNFQFGNYKKKQKQKQLHIVDAGIISVPSGKLMISDPFFLMHKENNPYIKIPSGNYKTYITITDDSQSFTGEPDHVKEAYISIIIDEQEIKKRRVAQERKILLGENPKLDANLLKIIDINQDRSIKEKVDYEYKGIKTVSKVIGIADLINIKDGMPFEKKMPWFENFFNYGLENSWFDMMDSPEHIRVGSANIELPIKSKLDNNLNNIIMTYCGRDDFIISAIMEYSSIDKNKLIAVHLDFGIIPFYYSSGKN